MPWLMLKALPRELWWGLIAALSLGVYLRGERRKAVRGERKDAEQRARKDQQRRKGKADAARKKIRVESDGLSDADLDQRLRDLFE